MKIPLAEFGGMFPVRGVRGTPPHIADYVLDADLSGGSLKPWRTDLDVSLIANAKSLYEIDGCCVIASLGCHSFAKGNPSPMCDETVYRADGITAPQVATQKNACLGIWWPLSFPDFSAPSVVAPAVPDNESREDVYVAYTVVDNLGRESAPSEPSSLTSVNFGTPLLVSGFPTTYPNGKSIKIYISRQSWVSGDEIVPIEEFSGFFLAKELPIGPASIIAMVDYPGPACMTLDYQPAPTNLHSIVDVEGSQLLGLSNNTLVASIKNTFHAWPSRLATAFYGVAQTLKAGRTMAYVLTDTAPMVVSVPSGCGQLDAFKCEQLQIALPCVSARGAAMHGDTVIFPSNDGLVAMSGSQWSYLPQWDKLSWQALRPDQMIGEVYNNAYFGTTPQGTFRLDLKAEPTRALTWVSMKPTAMHSGSGGHLVFSDASGIHSWGKGFNHRTAIWRRSTGFSIGKTAMSAVRMLGVGKAKLEFYSDTIKTRVSATVGSGKPTRFSPVRANEFGVEISTTGEVESVIIGRSESDVT